MLRPVRIIAPIFADTKDEKAQAFSMEALLAMLRGLVNVNLSYLKHYGKETPELYKSGVRYQIEENAEDWLTIPAIIAQGWGDCEDLAAWRTAELIARGIKAEPAIMARQLQSNGAWRAHAFVKLPDGSTEDPSAKLGMKGLSQ